LNKEELSKGKDNGVRKKSDTIDRQGETTKGEILVYL
jgi:hypothetical protein